VDLTRRILQPVASDSTWRHCGFDRQPEIASQNGKNAGGRPDGQNVGLDQHNENQSKNNVKMTKLMLKTTKSAKNHTLKKREILINIHLF
jgi:hypothetical protein